MGREPLLGESLAMIAASLIAAVLSWRFVERPFRGRSGLLPRPALFAAAALAALVLTGIGLHGKQTGGWLGRYPPELVDIFAAGQDRDPRQGECESVRADTPGCIYGEADAPPVVALLGDSHAAVYAMVLGELAQGRGESVLSLTMPICPPALGWEGEHLSWREDCGRFQRLALDRIIATPSIQTEVLAAWYRIYPFDDPNGELAVAIEKAIERLVSAGKRVALVYPVPQPDADVPTTLAEAVLDGRDPNLIRQPLEQFHADQSGVFAMLDGLDRHPSLIRIYPHQVLCPGSDCLFYRDGRVLYYDDNHLSVTGAALLRPLLAPLFDGAAQQGEER
ncbi:SGNH hydrolase domain-containing protein [Thiocapsa sp.]|uniref:SGNH hydrolase domain-containing protein n=1 Tax=Thiocapsa sp. TaxID=2024551 RepID=UPI002C9A8FB4|nr:SGNH hydrolase domain-containing protein [Thiocapsa sp.]HSO82218.1 SGNH hydrolase domain-containing protein [Thiocapsa sp.]